MPSLPIYTSQAKKAAIPMDDELPFEPDPLEDFALDNPALEALLVLAARKRHMSPSAYLAVLVDCDRRGVTPLWRR
jgi:hypothetical protein